MLKLLTLVCVLSLVQQIGCAVIPSHRGNPETVLTWGSGTCNCFGYAGTGSDQYLVTANMVDVNADCSDTNGCIANCYNYISVSTNGGDICVYNDYYEYTTADIMCQEVDGDLLSSPIVVYASLCDGPYLVTGFEFSDNLQCAAGFYTGVCAAE